MINTLNMKLIDYARTVFGAPLDDGDYQEIIDIYYENFCGNQMSLTTFLKTYVVIYTNQEFSEVEESLFNEYDGDYDRYRDKIADIYEVFIFPSINGEYWIWI